MPYKAITVDKLDEIRLLELLTRVTGLRTLPNIFFSHEHIGGYKDLKRLE